MAAADSEATVVVVVAGEEATPKNPRDLACQFCGSLVLLRGAARACPPGESHQLPAMHAKGSANPQPGDFPMEACPGAWWCVGDMLEFENVGFSHSVNGVRYLICADCEKGPVGFVQQQQGEQQEQQQKARHLVSGHRLKEVGGDAAAAAVDEASPKSEEQQQEQQQQPTSASG